MTCLPVGLVTKDHKLHSGTLSWGGRSDFLSQSHVRGYAELEILDEPSGKWHSVDVYGWEVEGQDKVLLGQDALRGGVEFLRSEKGSVIRKGSWRIRSGPGGTFKFRLSSPRVVNAAKSTEPRPDGTTRQAPARGQDASTMTEDAKETDWTLVTHSRRARSGSQERRAPSQRQAKNGPSQVGHRRA